MINGYFLKSDIKELEVENSRCVGEKTVFLHEVPENAIITEGLATSAFNMGLVTDGKPIEKGRMYKVILIPTGEFYG